LTHDERKDASQHDNNRDADKDRPFAGIAFRSQL
jgi:hypothetical protein